MNLNTCIIQYFIAFNYISADSALVMQTNLHLKFEFLDVAVIVSSKGTGCELQFLQNTQKFGFLQ